MKRLRNQQTPPPSPAEAEAEYVKLHDCTRAEFEADIRLLQISAKLVAHAVHAVKRAAEIGNTVQVMDNLRLLIDEPGALKSLSDTIIDIRCAVNGSENQ